ncbi:MAG: leucine-rich repeat protein [Lachnospiraceae bacterium]|nr:leucine-rich repeat protein [Lachnospiraceae bacterium]
MKRKLRKQISLLLAIIILLPSFSGFSWKGYEVKAYNGKKVEEIQPRLLAGEEIVGVIAKDGKLYAWGKSYYPSDAYAIDSNIPAVPQQAEDLEGIIGGSMAQGSVGVILQDKSLHTWGMDTFGMCGNGQGIEHNRERKEIFQNVRSVSMGKGVTMIVTHDNELYGCGSNQYGELAGKVDAFIKNEPIKIMDNVLTACAGGNTVAAITTDGRLYTWGQNNNGKLGNGTTEDSSQPQEVEGLEKVVSVSVGMFNMAAVTEDGSLYTWGNGYGNGNGASNANQLKPMKIMDHVKSVYMGYENGAAITEDGSLYTWGRSDKGQLGAGEKGQVKINKETPGETPIKIMDNVVEAAWGNRMGMALTQDGNVWTWGWNSAGQLGNGSNQDSNVPLNVFNIYSGICDGKEYGKLDRKLYEFDYDVNTYSRELAETSALYAMLAYDEHRVSGEGQYYVAENGRRNEPFLLEAQLQKDGFENIKPSSTYRDAIEHNCSYTFASRQIYYKGEKKNQIVIDVRGTDGVEWEGNMKLTGTVYSDKYKDTHYSFNMAKNLVLLDLQVYMGTLQAKGIKTDDSVIWVTGHSRGGVIANLLAAELTDMSNTRRNIGDVFGYTFATVNATTLYNKKPYGNIFNHCFLDDFVPNVPLASWGYGNYGKTLVASADGLYGDNFEFRNSMRRYTEKSSKRSEADFNLSATTNMLRHVGKVWKDSREYYEKRTNNAQDKSFVSLYMFFNDTIAILAQKSIKDSEFWKSVSLALLYCSNNNTLRPVFGFFINGQGINKNINDTHQAYTYYLATKLGAFQFASNRSIDADNVAYSKSGANELSDAKINEQKTNISDISPVTEKEGVIEDTISGNQPELRSVSQNAAFFEDIQDDAVSSNAINILDNNNIESRVGESLPESSLTQEEEKQKIIAFINQDDNRKNLDWNIENPDSWNGITFDEDGYVSMMDLSYRNLSGNLDLSGFSHLQSLDCSGNSLNSLDVTNCTLLENLECYFNMELETLCLEGCGNLKYLDCSGCGIQALELSDCTAMEELLCSNNQLTKLNLFTLSKLFKVLCDSNEITEMILPENNHLKHIDCEYNYLTNFADLEILSQNEENRILYQEQNVPEGASFCDTDIAVLKGIASTGENLQKLGWDLTQPWEWYGIEWKYENGIYYADKISLSACELEGNIKISNLLKLKALDLSKNQMDSLFVSDCPELVRINCVEAELEKLEIISCPLLTEIYGYYNYMPEEIVLKIEKDYEVEGSILELTPQYLKADLEEFSKEDVDTILSFADLEENQTSIYFDKEKPGCWDHVTWEKQEDGLYHITELWFESLWITGKFDMSKLKYLKTFSLEKTNITAVVLPENIEEIPLKAFYNCALLEEVTIPKAVKIIEDLAFADCTALKKLYFYSQNAQIGMNSFYNSAAIQEITCYANTTESNYAYDGQPRITYWNTSEDISQKEEGKGKDQIKSDTGSKGEDRLKKGDKRTVGNAVYKITKFTAKNKTVTYVKCNNKKAKSITIHNTVVIDGIVFKVTAIEKNAFKNMKKLQKVTIGKYVKSIGDKAFYRCGKLKKLQIKSTVLKKIGKSALKGINKKAVITVPKAKKKSYKKLLQKKIAGLPKTVKIK